MQALAKMSLKKEIHRKCPMTLEKIRRLARFLDLSSIEDLQFLALSRTCHNGLLALIRRGCENPSQ